MPLLSSLRASLCSLLSRAAKRSFSSSSRRKSLWLRSSLWFWPRSRCFSDVCEGLRGKRNEIRQYLGHPGSNRAVDGVTYRSRDEYCLVMAERSRSRAPEPPRAVSKVGRAAVVILPVVYRGLKN